MVVLNKLERRILDLAYKHNLSHLGSYLCSVNIIDRIYLIKKKNEPVVLCNGHAFLALAVVLEKEEGKDAEALLIKHGTHPNRDLEDGIYVSTGSLGQGLPIAVGLALADRTRDVYAVTSDGDMAEGSNWEALRIAAENHLENLRVTVVANGHGAYGKVDHEWLDMRMQLFFPSLVVKVDTFKYPSWLQGVDSHYVKLDEEKYKEVTNGQA